MANILEANEQTISTLSSPDTDLLAQSLLEKINTAYQAGPEAVKKLALQIAQEEKELENRAKNAEKSNIYDNFFANKEDLEFRILNHQGIRIEFGRQLELIKRKGIFTVLFLDLNNFKNVNDTLGHLAGDNLIRSTAQILHEQLRSTDLIGHPGGDEFLLGLVDTDQEHALEVATRIAEKLSNTTNLTTSIGIYQVKINDTLDEASNKADQALYQAKEAKEQGKNKIIIYS